MRLSRPAVLPIARFGHPTLEAGRYLYCGSAYGPGGLRARLRRHLTADKAPHWHVDHLRRMAQIDDFLAVPGERECDLVARFVREHGCWFPLPGFGSSDCRRCVAHLLGADPGLILRP